jgi:hypothetical protein
VNSCNQSAFPHGTKKYTLSAVDITVDKKTTSSAHELPPPAQPGVFPTTRGTGAAGIGLREISDDTNSQLFCFAEQPNTESTVGPSQHATHRFLSQTAAGFPNRHLSGTKFRDDNDVEGVDKETDGLSMYFVDKVPDAFPDAGLSPSMRRLPPSPSLRGSTDEAVETKAEADDFVDVAVTDVTGTEERRVPGDEVDDAGVDGCNVGGEGDLVIVAGSRFFAVHPTQAPPTQFAFVKDLRVVLNRTFEIGPVVVIEREMFGVERDETFSHRIGGGTAREVVVFVTTADGIG